MKAAVGIDIGGTNIKIILATEDGRVLQSILIPTPSSSATGDIKIEEFLVASLRDFLKNESTKMMVSKLSIAGIGIGVAGLIDRKNGKIIKSPNISALDGLQIRELFEKEFSLPVSVENDANAYAYGEKWIGTGRDIDNFIVLTLGTGLGGGHIYNNNLYEGPFEAGHIIIVPNGRLCPCGSYGCLESYASGRAIVDRAITSIEGGTKSSLTECCEGNYYKLTPELVFQKALDGDSLSREIFREVGHYLGIGISNLINIVNAEAVIIGGGLIGAWDLFIDEVTKEAFKRSFKPYSSGIKILKSTMAKDTGSIGAAGLLFNKLAVSQRTTGQPVI